LRRAPRDVAVNWEIVPCPAHSVVRTTRNVACSHVSSCPLFPKLNASRAGWRDAYCNTATNYQTCARYQLSLDNKPVPLALLPNGKVVDALLAPEETPETVQVRPAPALARTEAAATKAAPRSNAAAAEAPTTGWLARLVAFFRGAPR
jgi:hypothetical protein